MQLARCLRPGRLAKAASGPRDSPIYLCLTLICFLLHATCSSALPRAGRQLRHDHTTNIAARRLAAHIGDASQETRVRRAFKGATLRLTTDFNLNSGLCNQHISLVNLLSIALTAHVDVVLLPVALQRARFEDRRILDEWPTALADTLWDVDAISRFMALHGITVQVRPKRGPLPRDVQLPRLNYYIGQREVAQAALNLHDDTRAHLRTLPPAHLFELAVLGGNVTLHIPNLFISLRTVDSSLSAAVLRATPFARPLRRVAHGVVAALLSKTRATAFNGVHLRVEQDVVGNDTLDTDGNPVTVRLRNYYDTLVELKLDPSLPLYVASGIFVDVEGKRAGLYKEAIAWLEKEVVGRLASSIVHKSMFLLGTGEGADLQLEQLAVVDFLVLKKAAKFAGYGGSSFSYLLREMRAMEGKDRDTGRLIRCCFPGFDAGLAFPKL